MARYIDADALRDRFQALAYDDWNQGASTTWANAYNEAADMVDDMPTVDSERSTGTWEERIDRDGDLLTWRRFYCSACGGWTSYGKTKFCPHCGAKMEVEHE